MFSLLLKEIDPERFRQIQLGINLKGDLLPRKERDKIPKSEEFDNLALVPHMDFDDNDYNSKKNPWYQLYLHIMSPPVNKSRLKEYIKNEMLSRRRKEKLPIPRTVTSRRSNSGVVPINIMPQASSTVPKPAKRGVRQILEEANLLKGGRLSRLIKKARERNHQWKTNFIKRRHSWASL